MSTTLISQPGVEPVSLEEMRAQCRISADDTSEDTLLAIYIRAARQAAEHELQRALIAQTWQETLDAFPAGSIRLGKAQALAIEAVEYIDPDGNLQTLDAAAYMLDTLTSPGWLLPAVGYSWPATAAVANAVRVRFSAGYGDTADTVPDNVRMWIIVTAAQLYANREAMDATGRVRDLPSRFVDRLLDSERVWA